MTAESGQEQFRKLRIEVRVTETEKKLIKAHAGGCSLSVSDYLRDLGVGHKPKSKLDHEAIAKLADTNTNLGRLGGLMKLWITEKRRQPSHRDPAPVSEMERTWAEMQASMHELKTLIMHLGKQP